MAKRNQKRTYLVWFTKETIITGPLYAQIGTVAWLRVVPCVHLPTTTASQSESHMLCLIM